MKGTCGAIAKNGKPCRAHPTGNGLCLFHASPTKAADLGRAGGQKNRRPRVNSMPNQDGAASAIERLNLICIDLRNDVISPAKANVLLKVTYQQAELQHKMAVEQHLAKTEREVEDLKLLVAKLSNDNLTSEHESREDEDRKKEDKDQKPEE